jgi:GH24 family phage-related lysozyme (muramidase)
MTDITRLDAAVVAHESYRAFAYKDSRGLWTMANGRCVETHPLSPDEWKQLLDHAWLSVSISKQGADWLMQKELREVEAQLAQDYASFWASLNDARQNALIEMAYQMGAEKEEAFHQMIAAIRDERWADAETAGLNSLWAKETHARAVEIMKQLRTGEFL